MEPVIEPGMALTLATGVPVVAYLVHAIGREALGLPARWLPAAALLGGVLWSLGLAIAGREAGHPVGLLLQGLLVGQAASGARAWLHTYAATAPRHEEEAGGAPE